MLTTTAPTTTRRRPTRREAPKVETLKPGERVMVNLKGRMTERINCWLGVVTAVDATAIRLSVEGSRFVLSWNDATGERLIPWGQVESVKVVAPKEDAV